MCRRCVFCVLREHNSSNIPRMHECLFAEECIAHVQDRGMVRERVEGFQALELV